MDKRFFWCTFAAVVLGVAAWWAFFSPKPCPVLAPLVAPPVAPPLPTGPCNRKPDRKPAEIRLSAQLPYSMVNDLRVVDLREGETKYICKNDVSVLLRGSRVYVDLEAYTYDEKTVKEVAGKGVVRIELKKEGFTLLVPKGVTWSRVLELRKDKDYAPVVEIIQEK